MVKTLETPSKTSLSAPKGRTQIPPKGGPKTRATMGFSQPPGGPRIQPTPGRQLDHPGPRAFHTAGRGQSCAAREVASGSGFLASFALNRTIRRHAITTDNVGFSVVLPIAGRMADRIDQNPENIANEDVCGLSVCWS